MQDQNTPGYNVKVLTASGPVPNNGGPLGGFLIAQGTPTITLYDSQTASGYKLIDGLVTTLGTYYPCPHNIRNGLYASITGACSISFFVK